MSKQQAKANFSSGDLEKYKSALAYARKNKQSFQIVSTGLSRKIVMPNGFKLNYFGRKGSNNLVEGAFLVMMVRREIDAYIAINGIPPKVEPTQVQTFNFSAIKRVLSGKRVPVIGVDINACYWFVAHKLGYISDTLFERGLNTKKKKGLLIAIGCLNKLPMIKTYVDGECVATDFDMEYHNTYSPFYWNVINYTHELMIESFQLFGDDWYMFLTDCLFVSVDKIKDAQEFLKSKGFAFKNHSIEFKTHDERNITWYDYKDQKIKTMYAGTRDIHYYVKVYEEKQRVTEATL
jgi:hypothetical protein